MTAPVAIIGGGWAGCAAAIQLTNARIPVVLYESAPELGGRARRVERDGLLLDNGQHLLLGAYAQTLSLLTELHGERLARAAVIRRPLTMVPFSCGQRDALTLRSRSAPGRLGLLVGLLAARGLSFRERIANILWFRRIERSAFARPADETVTQMLASLPPRVAELVWAPLCLAALNTPVSAASSQVFANVLRAAFAGAGDASDFVLPATDLTDLLPAAAARYVQANGGGVMTRAHARVLQASSDGVTLAVESKAQSVQAVIVAVGPHQLADTFGPELLRDNAALASAIGAMQLLRYEPIVTIWLGYGATVQLPAPIARLDDAPGQWVVDRPDVLRRSPGAPVDVPIRQLLAVIISASGTHMKLPHATLVAAVDSQLRRLQPSLPVCIWSWVVAEKRATYACTPGRPRPTGVRLAPRVYLAGDYVDREYPATIEAAVRSGMAAAEAVEADQS